jgi:hypothetical protein
MPVSWSLISNEKYKSLNNQGQADYLFHKVARNIAYEVGLKHSGLPIEPSTIAVFWQNNKYSSRRYRGIIESTIKSTLISAENTTPKEIINAFKYNIGHKQPNEDAAEVLIIDFYYE